jgi:hypothetical protein
MENNLVELKYDKVNEYFEKFKQKYTNDYEKNKMKGTKFVRNYYSLLTSLIIISICPIILTIDFDLPGTVSQTLNFHTLITQWLVPIPLIMGVALLVKSMLELVQGGHKVEIEYTQKEYYSKIKSTMLNELKATLNNQITENMLIFDKRGLIIAPNLNTNEAKRIFGEANMRLTKNGK